MHATEVSARFAQSRIEFNRTLLFLQWAASCHERTAKDHSAPPEKAVAAAFLTRGALIAINSHTAEAVLGMSGFRGEADMLAVASSYQTEMTLKVWSRAGDGRVKSRFL